jgi:hypothetical protein
MSHKRIDWTHAEELSAVGQMCTLCHLGPKGHARNKAVTLAVVVGYHSSGGGGASLEPVCAEHAKQENVVVCSEV